MPCRTGDVGVSYVRDPDLVADLEMARLEADMAVGLLCSLCRTLDESAMPPEVAAWWASHEAEDERREEAEQLKAEAVRAKKMADYLKLQRELGLSTE